MTIGGFEVLMLSVGALLGLVIGWFLSRRFPPCPFCGAAIPEHANACSKCRRKLPAPLTISTDLAE
jgi:predicted amidophosphoribosyltransferase